MGYDFYAESYRKARKDHKCEACRNVIQKGIDYSYIVGVWEGDFYYYKLCKECKRVLDYGMDISPECEFTFDGIEEDVYNAFCEKCPHNHNRDDDCPYDGEVWHCKKIHKGIDKYYEEAKNRLLDDMSEKVCCFG